MIYINNTTQVMVRATIPDDNKGFVIQYGRKNVKNWIPEGRILVQITIS